MEIIAAVFDVPVEPESEPDLKNDEMIDQPVLKIVNMLICGALW